MLKLNSYLARLSCAMFLVLFISQNISSQTLKREFRSAWIATVSNIDWPRAKGNTESIIQSQKSSMIAYLDKMQEMNMTTVCFQVRSMCDAMYKSSYEPWSSYLTGTRGLDPGWDPLAFVVEECHRRGIEVYAWVNPYRWSSTGTESTWNTEFDNKLKSDGWLLTNGKYTVLNPAFEETRAHIVKVCREIITNYSVEGMIFDDYFYPTGGTPENSTAPDYTLWKNSGTSLSIGDWRRENVDKMVRDVYQMVQQVRPEVRFGIAPPGTAGESASKYGLSIWKNGYDTQYTSLYSDPLSWMSKGIVDFVSPQIYWHNDHSMAPFGVISNWWYSLAAHFGKCHCNVSVNIYDLVQAMGYQEDLKNTRNHWKEHADNVLQSRTYAAANGVKAFGSNFYSIQYFMGDFEQHADYVAQNCFPTKTLVPVVDWKTPVSYSAVTGLVYKGGTLAWNAVSDGLSTIRYTVYAIPNSVSKESAMTADGFDAQYLLGVTYSPSFNISNEKQSGYWYAVSIYDGYGNEHAFAEVGYPVGNYAQKATLVYPEHNADVTEDIQFVWENTDALVTGYTLQISSDISFASLKYTKDIVADGMQTTVVVPVSRIGRGTYHWRVISKGTTCFDTPSDYRTFTITDMGVGNYESGYEIVTDVADYSDKGNLQVENIWMRSVKDGFRNIVFAGSGTYNRSMVAVDGYVYLSGRTANSSSATGFLEKYDGLTGEHIGRITLGKAASVQYYPCNNVTKDSQGNVCVSNLAIMQYGPLVVHRVDLNTGALTEVAKIQSSRLPSGRFDHIAITGDVTTGNFVIYAADANTANIVKWKFSNGSYTETVTVAKAFYPTSATSFGVAPQIIPVSESDVFVDGGNTALTRYSLTDGSRSGSFLANQSCAPSKTALNAAAIFSLGNTAFVVYAYGDMFSSPSNTFSVASTTSDLTFSGMTQQWILPRDGMGEVNSQTCAASVAYEVISPNCVRLFLYIPGNGLCAYEITDNGISGMGEVDADADVCPADYFNLQGIKVARENLAPGIYIKKQGQKVIKILIK